MVKQMIKVWLMAAALSAITTISSAAIDCVDGKAGAYTCSNVQLLSHLTRAEIGGDDGAAADTSFGYDNLNSMWGWSDNQTGHEYALIGLATGTAFVDVTDPEHPVYLGKLPAPPAPVPPTKQRPIPARKATNSCGDGCDDGDGEEHSNSLWRDIRVYQNTAYIVSEQNNHGLMIFDLTRLRGVSTPQSWTHDGHITTFGNGHTLNINEQTGFLYVVGYTRPVDGAVHFGGLLIFNLSDRLHPQYVTEFAGIQYIHETTCIVYNGPDSRYQQHEICFAANSGRQRDPITGVYLRDSNNQFIRYSNIVILDVTDKLNIEVLDAATFEGSRYIHQAWPSNDLKYLIVNDELEEANNGIRTTTYVFNINILDDITLTSTYVAPTLSIDHNEYINGRWLFQSNYMAGLRILDASDPLHLFESAYFDVMPEHDDVEFEGTWLAYPFFKNGVVALSDISNGLFLVKPTIQTPTVGSDIGVSLAVQADSNGESDGRGETVFAVVANNSSQAAHDITVQLHLPLASQFADVSAEAGVTCSAGAARAIECRIAQLGSCQALVIAAPVAFATPTEGEIGLMASAREAEILGRTANNRATKALTNSTPSIDPTALKITTQNACTEALNDDDHSGSIPLALVITLAIAAALNHRRRR